MNEEMHPETSDRDNEYLKSLGLFIPLIQNHLSHGHPPEECRQVLPLAPKEQFEKLLAEASLAENPYENQCEDNLWLEPLGGVVGFVEQVNGPGAEECREFVPTKHELSVLAKYWIRERLNADWPVFCYEHYSSKWSRISDFAHRRLARIERILGREAFDAAEAEVKAEFASGVDPRLWNMFVTGKEPARDEQGLPILPNE